MEPETKKRKFIRPPPRRNSTAPSPAAGNKDPAFALTTTTTTTTTKPSVNADQPGVPVDPSIQLAKNHAITQAQQDGSKANFKIFDSPFANFLLPVIPSRAELGG